MHRSTVHINMVLSTGSTSLSDSEIILATLIRLPLGMADTCLNRRAKVKCFIEMIAYSLIDHQNI
jgi:hypothetical protein